MMFVIFDRHKFYSEMIYDFPTTIPKHGKYDYTHDWVYNHKCHSWLHDYVIHMDTLLIH
jgi:hypothetical protein